MGSLMNLSCNTKEEAIKAVLDKNFNGQQQFFEKVIAQSVHEKVEYWEVTIYLSDIFKAVRMVSYTVDKKSRVTHQISWIGI